MRAVVLAFILSLLLVTSACSASVPGPAATSPGPVPTTASSASAGGVWARLAPLPTARGEVAAAELSGKVYVIGGLGPGSPANEEYDPAANAWRKRASIPQPVDHAAAVSLEGKLYVIGGFDGTFGPVSSVWAYDPLADAWARKADLPTPRGALGAAVVGGRLYAIGGRGSGEDVGVNEVYDSATDTWTARSPMPTPRDHVAVSAVGGKIYVIGGRFGTFAQNTGVNEEYDPQRDTWMERASLPTPRSGIASAVVYDRIYVFGGEGSEGTFNQNERYHPAIDAWQAMLPMPTARHGLGAATVGNRIFVLAGGTTPGGSQSDLNEAFAVPEKVPTRPSIVLFTPTPTISTVIDDQVAWEGVARSVQSVSPILRPEFTPVGVESVRMDRAGLGTFWVEYSGPGKRLGIGAGAFNPPMVTAESGGDQKRVIVRGQPATLQKKSRAQPSESVQLWWQEPGEWVPGAGAPTRNSVFYMISAEGFEPDAVLQVANSLRPM